MAQVDYFLKLDGVAGEATDDKHKGELDLESFSWGVTNLGTSGHGGGAGAGKAQPQDMVVTKRYRQELAGAVYCVRDGAALQGSDADGAEGRRAAAGVSESQARRA